MESSTQCDSPCRAVLADNGTEDVGVEKLEFVFATRDFIMEVISMPRGDGTGPLGQGPKTGRGLGPCGKGTARQNRPGSGLMQRAGNMFRRAGRPGQRPGRGLGQGGRSSGPGRGFQSRS
ncbi:MAG: DUF5320 domain-containing protein [Thermodesulfobacteriota bacterium]